MQNPTPGWHSIETADVFDAIQTNENGLSSDEYKKRLQQYGFNRLDPQKSNGPLKRFLLQFHNVLIYVLIISGFITLLLGHWIDSGVIFGVVFINAIIGFIQEGKAEKALDAIRNLLSHNASVRRDGKLITVAADQLVPGDILFLQSGDKVPADIRLFKTKELRIDEAMLTGESVPADKNTNVASEDASIGDRKGMAYSGTLVTFGQGHGIVVATGDATEIGRISQLLQTVQTLTTPLIRQIGEFAKWLTLAIGILALLTLLYGVFVQNYSLSDMFIAAVGLTVAAIPEGLPAIMTITLAIGVQRMAKSNAIIRRLPAVETLGSITVICSDKTGTLTRNEMTVQTISTASEVFEVSGAGYQPHGEFSLANQSVDIETKPALQQITHAALLCNDASINEKDGQWVLQGDPTEGALVTIGLKAGLDAMFEHEQFPRVDVIPFESEHRFMATLHHDHAEHRFIYLKGAPEKLLEMCQLQRTSTGEDEAIDLAYWESSIENMASRGQRLLAIAIKPSNKHHNELTFSDVEDGLILLGIFGIIDPPRTEAISAVKTCQSAGIRVKMITGDHAITASAIGLQMGIGDGKTYIKGTELDTYSDEKLREAIQHTDVFARTSPEQKLRIVQALQASGEVVSMTGDGVNDAPALKRADVGVAMGLKGTEVAKEAAEMVLADDNFASISHAVKQGRTVYDNLKKTILFILPTNGGEALTVILAIILGRSLPITPVQILWINMITAVTLALALAFEPSENNVMQRPPRNPREPILSGFLIWRVVFVSIILVTGTFGMFVWYREAGMSIEFSRTVAVNTLVMFEIFYLFNSRYLLAPSLNWQGITGNRYVLFSISILIVFQMAFTYLPAMQQLFQTVSLPLNTWGSIFLVTSSVLILVEFEKAIFRYHFNKSRDNKIK